jgi:hypothetical protein
MSRPNKKNDPAAFHITGENLSDVLERAALALERVQQETAQRRRQDAEDWRRYEPGLGMSGALVEGEADTTLPLAQSQVLAALQAEERRMDFERAHRAIVADEDPFDGVLPPDEEPPFLQFDDATEPVLMAWALETQSGENSAEGY